MGGKIFIGIDPGQRGAAVAVGPGRELISQVSCGAAYDDIWDWFVTFLDYEDRWAAIETQTPRPTFVKKLKKRTILASTCVLFANYHAMKMVLECSLTRYRECTTVTWRDWLGIPPRVVARETQYDWKARLKAVAAKMYPSVKVTLANADALLIAEYCRLVHEG